MSDSNESKPKKRGGLLRPIRFVGRSLYKDLFQSIGYDIKLLKDEVCNTKSTLNNEHELLQQKSAYTNFKEMLEHNNMTLTKLLAVYRRYFIACLFIISAIAYLIFQIIFSSSNSVKVVSAMLVLTLCLYYVKYRMWMFMVEKKKFVKLSDWMKAMWSYPIRFFPSRPSKVFSSLLKK